MDVCTGSQGPEGNCGTVSLFPEYFKLTEILAASYSSLLILTVLSISKIKTIIRNYIK
jgi:hypothetical protein